MRLHSGVNGAVPTSNQATSSAMCGEGLAYSGHQPEGLVAPQEIDPYGEPYNVEPAVRTGNERRHPRIPSRNAQACVRTQFRSIVVNVTNVSRNGFCFRSTEKFWKGTLVSVATYYIEGGQNIFQKGKIVRVRPSPSGLLTEYGVEFLS
jgi:hypothetical protein